jgi:hypothetical protein
MKVEFFSTHIRQILISNLMKICPVGAELFYEDRQTDMIEANSLFS